MHNKAYKYDVLNKVSVRNGTCFFILYSQDDRLTEKAMAECDYAFTLSVIHRDNYPELLEKIEKFADVIIIVEKITAEKWKIVGYAAFYANDLVSAKGYITLICIRPEYQKQKLGSAMIETIVSVCRNKNMKKISLEVLKQDKGAIMFYKSKNFTIDSETDHGSYYMSMEI